MRAAPHMGSAYSTIAADVTARYQRLKSREVMFITGTDEHGEKIATAAAAQSKSPQEHCDGIAAEFQNLWQQVGLLTADPLLVYLCADSEIADSGGRWQRNGLTNSHQSGKSVYTSLT